MRPLLPLLLLTLALPSAASELVGDRPDFTESALAVPVGSWQLEAGATLETSDTADLVSVGEVLLRHGLKPGTEFRLILPSHLDHQPEGDGESLSGLDNVALGIKQELGSGNVRSAMLGHVTLPTGNDDVTTSATAVDLVLALEWDLPAGLGLGANLGGELVFDDETSSQQWVSAALGIPVADRLGAFVEGYSYTEELDSFATYLDTGLTYLLTPDWQVDARVGVGLDDHDDELIYGLGLLARF